ncbi:MAG: MMPL family transporter [Nocardioides sp.]
MSTKQRRWIRPLLGVIAWLLIAAFSGPFSGKLASVQENDNAAYLPRSAESTKVIDVLTGFQEQETIPITVVAQRADGLTETDLAELKELAETIRGIDLIASVEEPAPSLDGKAAQIVVQSTSSDGEDVLATVEAIRKAVRTADVADQSYVGGAGGILADFVEGFGAIDGILLLVALGVVFVILLLVYRAIILPFVVLFCAVVALGAASAVIYFCAKADLITITGQSQGILFILAVGAATDYSLLLVARFREELRDHESKYDAMRAAYKGAFEPILASGITVILGLLCLLVSDLASISGLGPVGAFGIAGAMATSLTLLPLLLVLLGRQAYWPIRPAYGSEHTDTKGLWGKLARLIQRSAFGVWAITFSSLAVLAGLGLLLNEEPIPQTDVFLSDVDSVKAQEIIEAHFQSDNSAPLQIVVPEAALDRTLALVKSYPGISQTGPNVFVPAVFALPEDFTDPESPVKIVDGNALIFATLGVPADSSAANDLVHGLRADLDEISPDVLVGGGTAINLDVRDTLDHDRMIVIPAILVMIFIVLAILLRALVAPLILLLANVLSFAATMGVSALLFATVFDFPASDPSTVLIGFVFLVALGVDYSIFLMTRVREEAIRQGTHPGILKGLSATGGVITSAGVVLAATFAALAVIPFLFLVQLAFIVAFGVLLDALVVRSLLVPALSYDVGRLIWWPSKLAREVDHADAETEEMLHPESHPTS